MDLLMKYSLGQVLTHSFESVFRIKPAGHIVHCLMDGPLHSTQLGSHLIHDFKVSSAK